MIRTQTRSSVYSADDPLSLVLRPPSSETEQERKHRVRTEAEAKLQSDRIDEQIRLEEREMQKKRKSEIKVCMRSARRSARICLRTRSPASRMRAHPSAHPSCMARSSHSADQSPTP